MGRQKTISSQILLVSNSGSPLYSWLKKDLVDFVGPEIVTFISAATVYNPETYFNEVFSVLSPFRIRLQHLSLNNRPEELIRKTKIFLVGGGNTYHLADQLRKFEVMIPIKEQIDKGAKYIGISAGANIAGPTILTTNDWNIVGATSFEGLNIVPFNINPHYLDPHDKRIFSGESRDDRIHEHFVFNNHPVVALKEKTFLRVNNNEIIVGGLGSIKLFLKNSEPKTFKKGQRISL